MEKFDFFNFDQKQFESKDRFEQNAEMQKLIVKHVLKFKPEELDVKPKKIDFFFYTDAQEKAEALSKDLQKLKYEVEVKYSDKLKWSICGCTNEITVTNMAIEKWTKEMCEAGYKNDCHFDGWGMSSDL